MIKIKKFIFFLLLFIFLCSIGVGFSYELSNEGIDCYSLSDDEIILLDGADVYFDCNVSTDGDGSENNPYKVAVKNFADF